MNIGKLIQKIQAHTKPVIAIAPLKQNCKAIAANPIDKPNSGFGSDMNQAVFLDKQGRQLEIAPCSKLQLAHHLFDVVSSISGE